MQPFASWPDEFINLKIFSFLRIGKSGRNGLLQVVCNSLSYKSWREKPHQIMRFANEEAEFEREKRIVFGF